MKRFLLSLSFVILHFSFSFAQRGANIVFIGNSITYGALHDQRELTAPPVQCAQWLSQQEGIDTVYFRNCGRSGKTTYHFLPNAKDVIPAGDKTYFGDVVAKTRELVKAHPTLPLLFSIKLGTNDAVERKKNAHTEPEAYVRNLTTIIDSLFRLWPDAHVVLNRPIYNTSDYVTKNGSVASKKSLKMMNTYYKLFSKVVANCKAGHVHVGDAEAYDYFKQHYKSDVFEEKDARGKSYWLHPNEQGAVKLGQYWGKAILPVLKDLYRETIWPIGMMPDAQSHQIAAMTDEAGKKDFKADKHRVAYLEWFDAPEPEVKTGGCMILISGGSYQNCCDISYIKQWGKRFTELGFQCVNFVYRTPRPVGLPIYQTAWEDGQRAVRMVRSEAAKRGFDPEKIGVISMSAGSHLALLLATSSQTAAYAPVDNIDSLPCHINWAIVNAPAYVTTDGEAGTPATLQGYGKDVKISKIFKFDEKTCPMSLHHGGKDVYSPNGSTLVYRELRKRKIPAELHLYPNKGHGAFGLERAVEFMRQMGYLGKLQKEVPLMDRYNSDDARREVVKENVWPSGKMPNRQSNQCEPYLEWHFPKELKTKAIQIIYSGGSYNGSKPDSFEVAPARRYLNERGMTVVTLKYRVPRPLKESGLAKHTTAWQDLQRAIKIVRSKADSLGLDPKQIGIMGSSAGGHLTLMGTTSSLHQSYLPIDDIDKQPCNVQWGIAIYPAYGLTDGTERANTTGGNDDSAVLVPEFSFDLKTAPMLFIHGDADGWAAMNSVKAWEKLRAMGIQGELHTLAKRKHCFQRTASPGTGSYTWLDRIGDFLKPIVKF